MVTIEKNIETNLPDLEFLLERYNYSDEIKATISSENLLPIGLLKRLHSSYPQHSGLTETREFIFRDKEKYVGKNGFREIVSVLTENGINIGYLEERELFIEIYRFMATKHVLNTINWDNFEKDSVFQLVFPQPGMVKKEIVEKYFAATTESDKRKVIEDYMVQTNPHDGKQLLNKPWYVDEEGELVILEGCQHKYDQCHLIFDKTTQSCFAFCTYCFRHAQVRGDEDMFSQNDIDHVHEYLKRHNEVTDVLITGGDGGYIPSDRLRNYVHPLINDPELAHIKTVRLGSRALTFEPEMILKDNYNSTLEIFQTLIDNGIQVVWMAHFSTPRELLNPSTIAAIKRLRKYGVVVKSQSPVMHHISMFSDDQGKIDIDRSAQNWIDLANIFAMLTVQFHSMYCARPTGEHHYFTVPLEIMNKIFSKVYRSLPSINRPTRYITMTSSAGKISLLGEVDVDGKKAFALKFNQSRNPEWMDKVFLTKYDDKENTIGNLKPLFGEKHFFEEELNQIEERLHSNLKRKLQNSNRDKN